MTDRDHRARRRDTTRPTARSPRVRAPGPLQLAAAVMAISMVLCMVASTCLAPY